MLLPYPEFIKDYILYYWKPGQTLLEIGCGISYMRSFLKNDYIGIDITDADYIEGIKRNVDIVCDAHSIPLPDNSVDIIFVKSTLYMMHNIPQVLSEIHRLLKPGGKVLIFDYNFRTQRKLKKRPGSKFSYSLWTQYGLWRTLKKAGFKEVKVLNSYFPPSSGIKRYLDLIKNELFHDWANVIGIKK